MTAPIYWRERYDFTQEKPNGPLAKSCLDKHIPFEEASKRFAFMCVYFALEKASGNQTKAARLLRIKRTTLQMILVRLGVYQPSENYLARQEAHRILLERIRAIYSQVRDGKYLTAKRHLSD